MKKFALHILRIVFEFSALLSFLAMLGLFVYGFTALYTVLKYRSAWNLIWAAPLAIVSLITLFRLFGANITLVAKLEKRLDAYINAA